MKKKKFIFKIAKRKSGKGYTYYQSNTLQYRRPFEKCKAFIRSGVNGPKTAFANIEFVSTFFTNSHYGFSLHRHFAGHNGFKQAQAWCNYLLNNYPYSHSRIDRESKK